MENRTLNRAIHIFIAATLICGVTTTAASADACITSSQMSEIQGTGDFETCGGDDVTYKISLAVPVTFGGVSYDRVYATTNSTITFGVGDNNYFTYPYTPSVSLQASDWVERSIYIDWTEQYVRPDEFFNIQVTTNGFTVDLNARPFTEHALWETRSGDHNWSEPVRNTFTVAINPDNTITIVYFSSSSSEGFRNGCVLSPGADHVSLDECGILQAASVEDIQLMIAQIAEEIIAQTEPINEPVQRSLITGTSFVAPSAESEKISLVIQGQFIEEITAIDVNGVSISQGDWVQSPTSVALKAPQNLNSVYKVQIYNQSVPVVPPQLFLVSQK